MEKNHTRKLLSRDQFREAVFARDGGQCVLCRVAGKAEPAVDAHHILERRLWPDGGYYLDNGASVCAECHIDCETTNVPLHLVREACGITKPILPGHLYDDQEYDKWGNISLPNGRMLKGELFHDESVQKALAAGGALPLFWDVVKYPRTHHVPWSEGMTDDDRMMPSLAAFEGKRVIVTEKMDGENTSFYCNYIHARSLDGRSHPSQDWVKQLWSKIKHDIPVGWRICGENLYAKHSLAYSALPSFFLAFSVWNDRNTCLSWDETCTWAELLGLHRVPVLFDDIYDEAAIRALWTPKLHNEREGYVIRVAEEFSYGQFRTHVGKFVRPNHVQTAQHWKFGQQMVRNQVQP